MLPHVVELVSRHHDNVNDAKVVVPKCCDIYSSGGAWGVDASPPNIIKYLFWNAKCPFLPIIPF